MLWLIEEGLSMYKIHYNMVPEYLQNIMPNIRSKESIYVTRQFKNNNIPKSRLNICPIAIDEWNAIPLEVRQSSTLGSFKNSLNTLKPTHPLYFSYEERYWNIMHTRLRHSCVLNIDLFRCRIIDSPA